MLMTVVVLVAMRVVVAVVMRITVYKSGNHQKTEIAR